MGHVFSSFSSIMGNLRRLDQIENIPRTRRYLRDSSNQELRGHEKIFGILFFYVFLENRSLEHFDNSSQAIQAIG